MKAKKPKYATIPIGLLQGIHEDQGGVIRKMFNFAIYDRMRKNYPTLEHEDFPDSSGIEESLTYFDLKVSHTDSRFKIGKELYDTFEGTPNASINIGILLEFQKEKTEFELMVFCFYCAIRSMIGTKPFYKGTDDYWILRAFGYSGKDDFEHGKLTSQNKDLIAKYSLRYHKDKIKKALQDDWFLVYYSNHIRGYFVSFKMDLKSLVNIAEDKKELSKRKESLRNQEIKRILADRENRKGHKK